MDPLRTGVDARTRIRLRQAGRRLHAAESEHRAAVAELKDAVLDADGRCSIADAAKLTGVSSALLEVIGPQLGADRTTSR